MDINDIPKPWRSALASIQILYPDAVMAGGCLRDREHGVKVKDIDIFVRSNTTDSGECRLVERKLKDDGWQDVKVVQNFDYVGSRIAGSIETKFPNCPPINVVVAPYDLAAFDFGICQIEFDGKRIHRTRDYHLDAAENQFRLIPVVPDSEFIRSLARWHRLKEKYPEWKLHLGSRAVTHPFVEKKRAMLDWDNNMSGPNIQQIPRPSGTIYYGQAWDGFRNQQVVLMQPGEYLLPKEVAKRLAKETTAQILGDKGNGQITVHVDATASGPASKIIQEMMEAKRQFDREIWARKHAHP